MADTLHFMVQDRHGYSHHYCGNKDVRSGRYSAYDWSDVTCPSCLRDKRSYITRNTTDKQFIEQWAKNQKQLTGGDTL